MKTKIRILLVVGVLCLFVLGMAGPSFAKNILLVGQALHPGQKLQSGNGRYTLVLQRDGNLVLYDGGKALWSSGTQGKPAKKLLMQRDGNLVLYGTHGPLWASNTSGNMNAFLWIQNDGNVVIYKPIWSTGTGR